MRQALAQGAKARLVIRRGDYVVATGLVHRDASLDHCERDCLDDLVGADSVAYGLAHVHLGTPRVALDDVARDDNQLDNLLVESALACIALRMLLRSFM